MIRRETATQVDNEAEPLSHPLEKLYSAIRVATRVPTDWQLTVDAVVTNVQVNLPSADDILPEIPDESRRGADDSHVLHVEPDGSFSVVALISRAGQATSIHDHTTWCAVAVIAGTEYEERFRMDDAGEALELVDIRTDLAGTVSGFAPPGDIHRVTNCGDTVGVSLHVYGTDIHRIGNSVRRVYSLPVRDTRPN